MNQEELQQKINEYYTKLTPQMQAVFSSMRWMEDLKTLVAKYNLNETIKEMVHSDLALHEKIC